MTRHSLPGATLATIFVIVVGLAEANRHVLVGTPRGVSSGDDLVAQVLTECVAGDLPAMKCVRIKALQFLDSVVRNPRARALNEVDGSASNEVLDEEIAERVARVLNEGEFSFRLPEVLFQNAVLRFRPGKGIEDVRVTFPQGRSDNREARGLLKKKLLLPALVLLKLKMKALMPVFVALIGAKALKALVLSKIAVLLVVGFLIVQLCKKAGMMMPMALNMGMGMNGMDAMAAAMMGQYGAPAQQPATQYGAPVQPTNQYGPPTQPPMNQYGPPAQPPPNQYGPPAQPPPNQYGPPAQPPSNQYGGPASSTASSYDPNSWAPVDSSGSGSSNTPVVSGPYSRWDAHNIAYSSYQPQPQPQDQSSTPSSAH